MTTLPRSDLHGGAIDYAPQITALITGNVIPIDKAAQRNHPQFPQAGEGYEGFQKEPGCDEADKAYHHQAKKGC